MEEEERKRRENMLLPRGARTGTTGGLVPDQGNAFTSTSEYEQIEMHRQAAGLAARAMQAQDSEFERHGYDPSGRPLPKAAPQAKPAFKPEAHSQIGERDPADRAPQAGQGTIRRGDEVFAYNGGSAVKDEDGSRRNFGSEGVAMNYLDKIYNPFAASRAPAQAAATNQVNATGTQPVQAAASPTASKPPDPTSQTSAQVAKPAAALTAGGPPAQPPADLAREFWSGRGGVMPRQGMMPQQGGMPQQGMLPSAGAVMAAPASGSGMMQSMFEDATRKGAVSPAVQNAFGPRQRKTGMESYTYDSSSGKPVPGWAQPRPDTLSIAMGDAWNRATQNAIWRPGNFRPGGRALQAAAEPRSPFGPRRRTAGVLPE